MSEEKSKPHFISVFLAGLVVAIIIGIIGLYIDPISYFFQKIINALAAFRDSKTTKVIVYFSIGGIVAIVLEAIWTTLLSKLIESLLFPKKKTGR